MTADEILIAEDDLELAGLLRRFLERHGFSVAVVEDGESAIERVRSQPPRVLLLDLMLRAAMGSPCARPCAKAIGARSS